MRNGNRSAGRRAHLTWTLACLLVLVAGLPAGATAGPQAEPAAPPEPAALEASAQAEAAGEVSGEEAPSEEPSPQEDESEATGDEDEATEDDEPWSDERSDRRERARQRADKDTQVHLMSDLRIDAGEVARDAVVLMGELHVDGKVLGDAVSILGPVYVEGEVTGSVTSVGDDVVLGPDSEVLGDVIAVGGRVDMSDGARVLGEVSEIDIGPALHVSHVPFVWDDEGPHFWDAAPLGIAWSVFWTIFRWVLLILVTSFVFLVARDAVEHTARAVSSEPWKAGLLGLATWLLFFPLMVVATIVLALSIIGIPLLIIIWPLGLFALLIACLVGYTATAYSIGGWLGRRFGWEAPSPYAALLLGVVSIQILSLIGEIFGRMSGFLWFFAFMFGLAGWLIRFTVWTAGLGATIMAFAERRRAGRVAVPAAAAPRSGQVRAADPEPGGAATASVGHVVDSDGAPVEEPPAGSVDPEPPAGEGDDERRRE